MIFKPYGIFIALSVLAGVYWTRCEAKKVGQDPEKVWELLPWVLSGGLVGARLYHVAHYWWYYSQDLGRILQVWHGGLAVYGALGGGLVGYVLYWFFSTAVPASRCPSHSADSPTRRVDGVKPDGFFLGGIENLKSYFLNHKAPLLLWLDLAAPGIALGQAVGRLGNVVNGELLPFAYYELIWNFLIFLKVAPSVAEGATLGKRFATYIFLYAFGRFFLEFLRTDNVWRWGSLTAAQGVSLGIIGLIGLIILGRRRFLNPSGSKNPKGFPRRRGEKASC